MFSCGEDAVIYQEAIPIDPAYSPFEDPSASCWLSTWTSPPPRQRRERRNSPCVLLEPFNPYKTTAFSLRTTTAYPSGRPLREPANAEEPYRRRQRKTGPKVPPLRSRRGSDSPYFLSLSHSKLDLEEAVRCEVQSIFFAGVTSLRDICPPPQHAKDQVANFSTVSAPLCSGAHGAQVQLGNLGTLQKDHTTTRELTSALLNRDNANVIPASAADVNSKHFPITSASDLIPPSFQADPLGL
ncbi:unnamed protein product [Cyprideis torosa]|uniref:Uncharacterized protein n=1 Tax=Cyprideis torosa TaxID=163714 RepID=A0A7R8W0C6_9CRUS|nr:unnamed protein product [Cyprideis torosa]CAG0879609.1 unnamed protein product [Cyprideis torosa]